MGYFPMCIDLRGKKILLMGDGPQIADKMEKLGPFGPQLIRCDALQSQLLDASVAFVVVGDTEMEAAARISGICREKRIPVNVVDAPHLSSFMFPALITSADVTVSVSTGGKAPAGAAALARHIRAQMPERAGEIIDWLHSLRENLRDTDSGAGILREAAARAFALGRPLTEEEMLCYLEN